MSISRLLCILFLSVVHVTAKGQDISVQKPLPFPPFDTIADGKLLVTDMRNMEQYHAQPASCKCKLKELKMAYLPEKGDYHEFGKVEMVNGYLPPNIQRLMGPLKNGDKVFLSDFVFDCQNSNCSANGNIGTIALKVTGR